MGGISVAVLHVLYRNGVRGSYLLRYMISKIVRTARRMNTQRLRDELESRIARLHVRTPVLRKHHKVVMSRVVEVIPTCHRENVARLRRYMYRGKPYSEWWTRQLEDPDAGVHYAPNGFGARLTEGVALGVASTAYGSSSIAIGYSAAAATDTIAIGAGAYTYDALTSTGIVSSTWNPSNLQAICIETVQPAFSKHS